jgi:phenylpropionate dioxygenase-like ring-hydroxylating dioxygenase large terminal subunit
MYPLNTEKPWPENQWYVAAVSEEVGHAILGRTLLNRPIIMFRDDRGVAHALSGVCPHRMMPLEMGELVGNQVVCAYHGLTFDTTGACVAAPTSSRLPHCALTRYPAKENAPFLWVWLGDPAAAESTPLPSQESIGLGSDGWRTDYCRYFELKARYSLLVDNLFDLSHLAFIHRNTAAAIDLALTEPFIQDSEDRLVVSRELFDAPADIAAHLLFPAHAERTSRRLDTEMIGMSLIRAGGPFWDGPNSEAPLLGHQNFIHVLTPESETSTHYWSLLGRDFRLEDDQLSAELVTGTTAIVQQDIDALGAIEQVLSSSLRLPREISMLPDQGAVRARRRLIQMIKADTTVASPTSGRPHTVKAS